MAYGVYDCDRYLPVEETADTENDPVGIHTHGDGLIHIHPFTAEAEGERAILVQFFDSSLLSIEPTFIRLPGGRVLAETDDCRGQPSTVRLLTFDGPDDTEGEVVKGDPRALRLTDGGIIALVRAPVDAAVPPPPSVAVLAEPADA